MKGITVGFFGGSFNPVHNGHIALARAIVERGLADEVWMVLSPLNPFKEERREELLADADRYAMLRLGVEGVPGVRASDIELRLPRPSYTITTLRELQRQHPACSFRLIIGSDNAGGLDRWREADTLRREFSPIVYPRPGYPCVEAEAGLPMLDVSSTDIRRRIACGLDVNNMLPESVLEYIKERGLYARRGCPEHSKAEKQGDG